MLLHEVSGDGSCATHDEEVASVRVGSFVRLACFGGTVDGIRGMEREEKIASGIRGMESEEKRKEGRKKGNLTGRIKIRRRNEK